MHTPEDFQMFSTYLLVHAAEKRGLKVTKILPETTKSFVQIETNGKQLLMMGQRPPQTSYAAYAACRNKEVTRRFLEQGEIQTTQGKLFSKEETDDALQYCDEIGFPVVIKPVDGTWGTHVFLNIQNDEEARNAIKTITKNRSDFLVENMFTGNEYRILATHEKTLGIALRIPANVVGDGESTIEQLIEEKNSDPRRGEGHSKSLVNIQIDDEILDKLKEEGLSPQSIPEKDQQVFLRYKSNLSAGGDSIDYTDKAHPEILELAPRIIRSIPGLMLGGIDFMTEDISQSSQTHPYAVIEINDSPMLSMHQLPYEGKQRDVAGEIIDLIVRTQ